LLFGEVLNGLKPTEASLRSTEEQVLETEEIHRAPADPA